MLVENDASNDFLAGSQCLLVFLRTENNYNLSKKIYFCQHLLTHWVIMVERTCRWLTKDVPCADLYRCHVPLNSPSITNISYYHPLPLRLFSGNSDFRWILCCLLLRLKHCLAPQQTWTKHFLTHCWTVNKLTLDLFHLQTMRQGCCGFLLQL